MPPDSARLARRGTQTRCGRRRSGRVPNTGAGSRRSATASRMISGLRDVRLDEVLRFAGGQVGFARVLDPDLIGCVLLDAATDVEAGDAVFGTGEVVNVPVGEALLGRIVDPLGRPLDGKGADRGRGASADRAPRALDHRTRSRDRAGADRHRGGGHAVRPWPGPARTDRRRPFHRQDDARHRRADRAARQRHDLHLRRRGAEDIQRAPRHRRAAEHRAISRAASCWSRGRPRRRGCNGSRPMPA